MAAENTIRVYDHQTMVDIAHRLAWAQKVEPRLVCAVCDQESSWKQFAVRFEGGFYEHYTKPMNLPETEELQRACSYGLMQIMGEVARELGFIEPFETLYDAEVNIFLGTKKLRRCLDAEHGNVVPALLRYNGGSNKAYPQQVLAKAEKYRLGQSIEIEHFGAS